MRIEHNGNERNQEENMSKTDWRKLDGPLPPPKVSKLRIDFDDPDVSPQLVRGLLARYGGVHDVTVYSGLHGGTDVCYAIATMLEKDVEAAIDGLKGIRWRGGSLMAIFAHRGHMRTRLPDHDWKPPREPED